MHVPTALSVVRRVSSVSTITTRNYKDIKSIFGADVHHVPGLCLLGIGGAPYISHKIIPEKPNFHIFDFSETTSRWCFILIMLEDSLDVGHYNLLNLYWNSSYRHFGRTMKIEKCKNLVPVCKTFKNLLLQNCATKTLDITYK